MHFLFLKIPVMAYVSGHARELEDKVDHILKEHGVGSVAGWGESLGAALADGSRPVAYTRIDIDISNLVLARQLLQANLPSLGAPTGTQIHYTIDRRRLKDVYVEPDWLRDQAA
jgi:hypothetical protein